MVLIKKASSNKCHGSDDVGNGDIQYLWDDLHIVLGIHRSELEKLRGVSSASVSYATEKAVVEYEADSLKLPI